MAQTTPLKQGKFLTGLSSVVGDTRRQYEDRGKVTELQTMGGLDLLVAIVADGVGSADNGGLAAQLSIDSVVSYMSSSNESDIALLITNAIKYANHVVYKDVITRDVDASTTLVVGVFYKDRFYVGNVGDSRAYWIQESGKVMQLTLDHSYSNIKGTDPNAPNADVLVNAIGIRKEVFADIGLYVKDKDRQKAAKIGMQGLPLKLGDTILLCSDGLIKSDTKGERFVREDEIVHALQSETQPNAAAVKMTGLAEGRYVDDNVTALTVQYTSPELIENVLRKQERKALRQKLIYVGLGLVAVGAIVLGSVLIKNNKDSKMEALDAQNQVLTLTYLPSPTSGATPTPTPMIALKQGTLKFASMGSMVDGIYQPYPAGGSDNPQWSVSGLEAWTPIKVDGSEEITLKTTTGDNSAQPIDIQTFGDVGVMLSLGAKLQGNSSVFIYGSSNAKLTYTDIFEMELQKGTVFLRLESRSEIAQIKVPYQQNGITEYATAKLTGGSMLLHLNGDEVQLWCLKDDCLLEFARDSVKTFAVQRQSYFPATGAKDQPLPIMPALYDELWAYNLKCNKCMNTNVVPEPTPTPTPLPPTATLKGETRQPTITSTPTPTNTPPTPPTPTFTRTITPITPVVKYTLALIANPGNGGGVSANKVGPFLPNEVVTVTASANNGWEFTEWSGAATGTSNPVSITMTGNLTVTANFQKKTWTVSVNASPAEGGTVTGGGVYEAGQQATITASANDGYNFTGWSGACGGSGLSCTFTVTENVSFTANFQLKPPTTFTVTLLRNDKDGGSVSGGGTYQAGTVATISASPKQWWKFLNWSGGYNGTDNPYSFTVTGDVTITAIFIPDWSPGKP